ncbi:MAG: formate dehydrogenase subunit gamma, partial [Aurantimonas coralicida]|nr:formate dehydrogenase subunit gamma [Aurantimonas coralicida]
MATMTTLRTILAAGGLALALLATPVVAQQGDDNLAPQSDVAATDGAQADPSGQNPTAEAPTEQQLLNALQGGQISGRVSIPDSKAAVLEQPEGRDYQSFHEGWLPWIGAIAIIGMVLALAAFYFSRGRIMIE